MPYYSYGYYGDFLANNIYCILLIPVFLLSIWAQFQVSGNFRRYSGVTNRRRITGAQAAQRVLSANGVSGVRIERVSGNLTDHFDPKANVIRLSDNVYGNTSAAAIGVACHEAGHALICRLCGVTPSFLTVVSRGGYGGFMESAGEKTSGTYTYQELMDRVCRCLAGRAAEIEVYGEVSGNNTGASSDIRQARYFMKSSLNDYAMGEKLYARWTQEEIEQQMQSQYQRTCQMIRENRKVLDALTDRLMLHRSMDQAQLEEFFTAMGV